MHPIVGGGCEVLGCVVVFGVERFPVVVSGGGVLVCLVVLEMISFGVSVDGRVVGGTAVVGVFENTLFGVVVD